MKGLQLRIRQGSLQVESDLHLTQVAFELSLAEPGWNYQVVCGFPLPKPGKNQQLVDITFLVMLWKVVLLDFPQVQVD